MLCGRGKHLAGRAQPGINHGECDRPAIMGRLKGQVRPRGSDRVNLEERPGLGGPEQPLCCSVEGDHAGVAEPVEATELPRFKARERPEHEDPRATLSLDQTLQSGEDGGLKNLFEVL